MTKSSHKRMEWEQKWNVNISSNDSFWMNLIFMRVIYAELPFRDWGAYHRMSLPECNCKLKNAQNKMMKIYATQRSFEDEISRILMKFIWFYVVSSVHFGRSLKCKLFRCLFFDFVILSILEMWCAYSFHGAVIVLGSSLTFVCVAYISVLTCFGW